MSRSSKPQLPLDQVQTFLESRHSSPIVALQPVDGGYWSAAYSFTSDNSEYILRLSAGREGFDIDRAAMRFASPGLPIPEVTEVGSMGELYYALSRRHHGEILERHPQSCAPTVGELLCDLLRSLRAAHTRLDEPVEWYAAKLADDADSGDGVSGSGWRSWVAASLADNPASPVDGWRSRLAKRPRFDAVFKRAKAEVERLLPHCPERRDLVHGDLLHQNVLLAHDLSHVSAVFSWKCSALGDFLYDVAWCTFWGQWFDAFESDRVWQGTLVAPDLTDTDLHNATLRRRCYEFADRCLAHGLVHLDRGRALAGAGNERHRATAR